MLLAVSNNPASSSPPSSGDGLEAPAQPPGVKAIVVKKATRHNARTGCFMIFMSVLFGWSYNQKKEKRILVIIKIPVIMVSWKCWFYSIDLWREPQSRKLSEISEVRFEYPHIPNVEISLSPHKRFLNHVIDLSPQNTEMIFLGYGADYFLLNVEQVIIWELIPMWIFGHILDDLLSFTGEIFSIKEKRASKLWELLASLEFCRISNHAEMLPPNPTYFLNHCRIYKQGVMTLISTIAKK